MKSFSFLIVSLILAINLSGQKLDTLFFEKVYKPIESFNGMTEVYKLKNDTIYAHSKAYKIKLPNLTDSNELAYCFVYYKGWNNAPIKRESVLLLSGYTSQKIKIFVDDNQNLNFSDDKAPLIFSGLNDTVNIEFKNSERPNCLFNVDLVFRDFHSNAAKERIKYLIQTKTNGNKIQLIDSKFWFSDRRRNSLIFKGLLNSDSIMLGIHDYDCDGIYNSKNIDKIMVGNPKTGRISSREHQGAYTFEDTTVIKLNSIFYEIVSIEESGAYIVLKATTLKSKKIEIGDEIHNFNIKLINDSTVKLHNILVPNKYTLVDIWGTWCAPCLKLTDELLRIHEVHNSNLQILALNIGDSKEDFESYVSQKKLKWLNGYFSKEIQEVLKVDGYPFLILIDKDMKIIQMMTTISEVEKVISKY